MRVDWLGRCLRQQRDCEYSYGEGHYAGISVLIFMLLSTAALVCVQCRGRTAWHRDRRSFVPSESQAIAGPRLAVGDPSPRNGVLVIRTYFYDEFNITILTI